MKNKDSYGPKPQNDEDAHAAIIGLYGLSGLIICAAIVYFFGAF